MPILVADINPAFPTTFPDLHANTDPAARAFFDHLGGQILRLFTDNLPLLLTGVSIVCLLWVARWMAGAILGNRSVARAFRENYEGD